MLPSLSCLVTFIPNHALHYLPYQFTRLMSTIYIVTNHVYTVYLYQCIVYLILYTFTFLWLLSPWSSSSSRWCLTWQAQWENVSFRPVAPLSNVAAYPPPLLLQQSSSAPHRAAMIECKESGSGFCHSIKPFCNSAVASTWIMFTASESRAGMLCISGCSF